MCGHMYIYIYIYIHSISIHVYYSYGIYAKCARRQMKTSTCSSDPWIPSFGPSAPQLLGFLSWRKTLLLEQNASKVTANPTLRALLDYAM